MQSTDNSILLPRNAIKAKAVMNLRIGVALPLSDSAYKVIQAPEWRAAFNLAVEYFKTMSTSIDITPLVADTTGNCTRAAYELIAQNVLVVVGPYESACALEMAAVFAHMQIPQVGFASISAQLSDKALYPTFFRVTTNTIEQGRVLAKVMHHFGWSKAGVIAATDAYGADMSAGFQTAAATAGINITTVQELPVGATVEDALPLVQKLREGGSAINLISMHKPKALLVLEAARILGMTGPRWVWLTTDSSTVTPTSDGFEAMSMIGTQPPLGSGAVFERWMQYDSPSGASTAFRNRWSRQSAPGIFFPGPHNAQLLDAVTAAVEAFNRSLAASAPFSSDMYDDSSNHALLRKAIVFELRRMNSVGAGFDGAVGERIYFNQEQDGPRSYDVASVVGGRVVDFVGECRADELSFHKSVVWGDKTTSVPTEEPFIIRRLRVGFTAPWANPVFRPELERAFEVAASLFTHQSDHTVIEPFSIDGAITDEVRAMSSEHICHAVRDQIQILNLDAVVMSIPGTCADMLAQYFQERDNTSSPIFFSVNSVIDDIEHPDLAGGSNTNVLASGQVLNNMFRMQPARAQEGVALANLACFYSFQSLSILRTDHYLHDETAASLHEEFRAHCNGTVMADVAVPLSEFSAGALDVAMDALKRSDTAVFVLLARSSEEVTLAVHAAERAGIIGQNWVWLHDKSVASILEQKEAAAGDLDSATGFLGLRFPAGEGVVYDAFVSYDDDEGLGEAFRSLWTHVDDAGEPIPDPRSITVHDAVQAIQHALLNLILEGEVTFVGDALYLRGMLLLQLQRSMDAGSSTRGAIGREVYFDALQTGTPFFHVANVVDGVLKTVASIYKEEVNLRDLVTWPSGSRRAPSGRPIIHRNIDVLVVMPDGIHTDQITAGLAASRAFLLERHQALSMAFHTISLNTSLSCEESAPPLDAVSGTFHATLFPAVQFMDSSCIQFQRPSASGFTGIESRFHKHFQRPKASGFTGIKSLFHKHLLGQPLPSWLRSTNKKQVFGRVSRSG